MSLILVIMKYKIIQILIFLLIPLTLWSQTLTEIPPPTLEYKNECLTINYSIDSDKSEYYTVWIEIFNSSGKIINAQALSGDIGQDIKTGQNKTIIWNLAEDNIFLDESISVKVFAQFSYALMGKGKLIIKSAVWPGWGQSEKGKPYWLVGVASIGCLTGSYLYNQQSINSYNQYIKAISLDESNKYYDLAIQQNDISQILAYSAIGIWTINIIWAVIMPNKKTQGITYRNVNFNVSPVYADKNNSSISFFLHLNL